jgi:hypothetical protein
MVGLGFVGFAGISIGLAMGLRSMGWGPLLLALLPTRPA